MKPGN
jgi:hypothetical protein